MVRRRIFDMGRGLMHEHPLELTLQALESRASRMRRCEDTVVFELLAPTSQTFSNRLESDTPFDLDALRVAYEALSVAGNDPYPALSLPGPAPGEQHVASPELHETLVEFAKAGNKDDFYFLARSSGLQDQMNLDTLWAGTRQRLRLSVV